MIKYLRDRKDLEQIIDAVNTKDLNQDTIKTCLLEDEEHLYEREEALAM